MQMTGLQHEVCWSNSRQQYTHLVWGVWHSSFSTAEHWIQILYFSQVKQPLTTSCCLHAKNPPSKPAQAIVLTWFESTPCLKKKQNGQASLDIFPSEKSNLYKLAEWHTWCGMHASLCNVSDMIFCEYISIDFYLFFHSILGATFSSQILYLPAHCLLSS